MSLVRTVPLTAIALAGAALAIIFLRPEQPLPPLRIEPATSVTVPAPDRQPEPATKAEEPSLERLPPRPPLSTIARADKPKTKLDDWSGTTVFQPTAEAAGVLRVKQNTIMLAGIEPLPIGTKCTANGVEWPCGIVARTAFRAFLRGRAVSCRLPEGDLPERIIAECRLVGQDIGAWLVAQGWAEATSAAYNEAAKQARAEKKGRYGQPPGSG